MNKFAIKKMSDGRVMLNLACGERYHAEFTNLDYYCLRNYRYKILNHIAYSLKLISKEILERADRIISDVYFWDLRKGIPFKNSTFDVVYCSHFLEHLEKDKASRFLDECYRVLKANGILRIVVPDLEKLALAYVLACKSISENINLMKEHELAGINLIDQMVRKDRGGETDKLNKDYNDRSVIRFVIKRLFSKSRTAEKIGEIHKWMYDRHSLRTLLEKSGFMNINMYDAFTSGINGWSRYSVDVNKDGSIYKPESLYMEGIKPSMG